MTEYGKFMFNPENICKCECCPENSGFDGRYPCGQQRCWVIAHCESSQDDED